MGQEDRERDTPFDVDPKLQPNAASPLNGNGNVSVPAEPTPADVRTTIGAGFGRQVVDAVSRRTRLTIAAVLTTALLLLWGSMAYLRSEARELEPAPAAAAVGLISPTVDAKQNPVPSNAVPFALISYGVVMLEIGIAWAYHDPFAQQLRAIERRSRRSKRQANKEQSRVR
jgi:hypothetical protein